MWRVIPTPHELETCGRALNVEPTSIQPAVPVTALAPAGTERRRFERVPRSAFVTALVLDGSQLRVHTCRMSSISASGARLSCSAKLGQGELYLRILMDGLQAKIIRADVVHEQVEANHGSQDRRQTPRYSYGVSFDQFVSDPEMLARLEGTVRVDRP
jgi:hypothetical protein